jgi:hypothetical protein
MSGTVEAGVRKSLRTLGIKTPGTALELLAITLARALDSEPAENNIAALSRELRLTLEQCAEQPSPSDDAVERLVKKQEQ